MIKKVLFFILIPFLSFAQITPCVGGMAGSYPCNDYDLLSQVPITVLANTIGTPEGSDCWGWVDPMTNKEYAIVATTNSTAFVDVTDPVNPIFLGRVDTNTVSNFWRDVKVYNNHAFIVADNVGAHGMQVFDLTRLRGVTTPQTFAADAIFTGVGSCHNIVINETVGVAYLVGCNTFSGGPVFVDITDPINPTQIAGYSAEGYTHDAQVVTYNGPDTEHHGKEIFIGSNASDIVILDVTDKNNVIKLSDLSYAQTGYTHQGWFTDDQRYFILGDETDETNGYFDKTRTLVFDFVDLDNPTLNYTHLGETAAIDHNGYVLNDKFYIANYRAGLRVLDITNIAQTSNAMTEIGYFDTYPSSDSAAFNGAWSVYPYFPSGNIIISDIEGGLFVVRQSGTLSVSEEKINNFTISPNPANDFITIKTSNNIAIKNVELYDILGRSVLNKTFDDTLNQTTVDLSRLHSGVYIAKINHTETQKIIIQ